MRSILTATVVKPSQYLSCENILYLSKLTDVNGPTAAVLAAAAADNDDNRSVFNLLKVVIILSGCCLVAIIVCSTHPQFILLFCLVDYGIYIMTVKYCPVGLRVEGVLAVS